MATLTSSPQHNYTGASLGQDSRRIGLRPSAQAQRATIDHRSVASATPVGLGRQQVRQGKLWARAAKRVLAALSSLSGPPATERERTRRETAQAQVSGYQGISSVWNQRC